MKEFIRTSEKELDDLITKYRAQQAAKEKEKSGGGVFGKIAGAVGDVIGGNLGKALEGVIAQAGGLLGTQFGPFSNAIVKPLLEAVEKVAGKKAADALLKSVGGPLLMAIGNAIGGPALGALVAQLGPKIIEELVKEARGGSSSSSGSSSGSSSSSSSSSSAGGESEQLQMIEIQRVVDKLERMYSAISNVLKSLHDSKMTAIGNLR
jgi:hypothetical protein